MNFKLLSFTKEIRNAVLMIHGEKAHSRYFSEDAYRDMTSYTKYRDNKELLIIPGANHTDLYDGGENHDLIAWDSVAEFFNKNMK